MVSNIFLFELIIVSLETIVAVSLLPLKDQDSVLRLNSG